MISWHHVLLKSPYKQMWYWEIRVVRQKGNESSYKTLPHVAKQKHIGLQLSWLQVQHTAGYWWLPVRDGGFFSGCRWMKSQLNSWCSSTPTLPSALSCRTARGPWRELIRWAGPPTCRLPPPNVHAHIWVHFGRSAGAEKCRFEMGDLLERF